ncbi:MAG: TonB-dependent receptor plug domain-containing protein [Caulobacteraceae bacterium]|nr:TonB-dependent receptor plug domain-containing protein [Caulobacteraceae bacterium]
MSRIGWVAMAAACLASAAGAQGPGAPELSELEVTATRVPEPVDRVPAYISVIRGEDLRSRRITDLRGALALVAGVEAPSGGDAGPASAVPSFWGLHEFDAFLLVVDGVPWGGAFNPAIPTLNLTDVERIEVLKGSAPVLYGATSFVGVIQVIHYPAGQAANQVEGGFGTFDSWRGAASLALPPIGDFKQSLALDARRDGYSDSRENVREGHALYRAAGPLAGGAVRFDAGIDVLRSAPPSPVPREGAVLTTLTPLDANLNPANARIHETRWHGVLGYSHPTPLGPWETAVSLAASRITFKPAALDFGPDNTPDILERETARSYEIGAKGRLAGGAPGLRSRPLPARRVSPVSSPRRAEPISTSRATSSPFRPIGWVRWASSTRRRRACSDRPP